MPIITEKQVKTTLPTAKSGAVLLPQKQTDSFAGYAAFIWYEYKKQVLLQTVAKKQQFE